MPIEVNANIIGTCVVNEIRPEPMNFYWMLGDAQFHGLDSTTVVNHTYGVLSIESTFSQVADPDDDGKTLMCVLVMPNGEIIKRNMHIDVVIPVEEKGAYISVYYDKIHSAVLMSNS